MFTSIDKAIVAVLSGGFFVLAQVFGWDFEVSPELWNSIGALVTGALVWLTPNK